MIKHNKSINENVRRDVLKIIRKKLSEGVDNGQHYFLCKSDYNGRYYISTTKPYGDDEYEEFNTLWELSCYVWDEEIQLYRYNQTFKDYCIVYDGYNQVYFIQTKEGLRYMFETNYDEFGLIVLDESNNLDEIIRVYETKYKNRRK